MAARIDRIDNAADCLAKLPLEDLKILQVAILRLQEYHATLFESADNGHTVDLPGKPDYIGARMMHHAINQAILEVEKNG